MASQLRTERAVVRLTRTEKRFVMAAAKGRRKNITEFIRDAIFSAAELAHNDLNGTHTKHTVPTR